MSTKGIVLFVAVSLATLCPSAEPARADISAFATYGFIPLSRNSGSDADVVAGQLSFVVSHAESESPVLFTFANGGPMPSSVTGVYFDDGAGVLGSLLPITNGSGASFVSGGKPDNLPAPAGYHFEADFWATARPPKGLEKNGVDIGESVTIPFELASGKTWGELLDALELGVYNPTVATGTLRVGIHVQSIGVTGESDSFIDPPPPPPSVVPLPGAVLLGIFGLGAAGLRLRQFA